MTTPANLDAYVAGLSEAEFAALVARTRKPTEFSVDRTADPMSRHLQVQDSLRSKATLLAAIISEVAEAEAEAAGDPEAEAEPPQPDAEAAPDDTEQDDAEPSALDKADALINRTAPKKRSARR
ncbi:hypothetical protein AB0H58_16750 [Nocardia neocaledoniensis]|uniref:hypothetical protein n=1 Tax=Nocardia neocaledoniensis TaxID=236511 RepID=UPI0033D61B63